MWEPNDAKSNQSSKGSVVFFKSSFKLWLVYYINPFLSYLGMNVIELIMVFE